MKIRPEIQTHDLSRIQDLVKGGEKTDADINFLRHVNAIIQSDCRKNFINIGTQFFQITASKIQGTLSNGAYIFRGFSASSFVVEGGLMLNIDVKHGIFIQENLVNKVLKICGKKEPRFLGQSRQNPQISHENHIKISAELKGLNVMINCTSKPEDLKSGKISEILAPHQFAENVKQLKQNISVDQFVYKKYGVRLDRDTKFLPVVKIGGILFPMELLDLMPTKKAQIQAKDRQKFIQNASIDADKRMEITSKMAGMKEYKSAAMRSYGFEVDTKPVELKARVLPPPKITKENGEDIPIINTKVQFKDFCECPKIGTFGIVIVTESNALTQREFGNFERHIQAEFNKKYAKNEQTSYEYNCIGIKHMKKLRRENDASAPDMFRLAIRQLDQESRNKKGQPLQWVMPILPDNTSGVYEIIKRICDEEGENGLLSHCVKESNVLRMDPSKAENIIFKLNAKLGGIAYRIHPQQIWESMEERSDSRTTVPGMTYFFIN